MDLDGIEQHQLVVASDGVEARNLQYLHDIGRVRAAVDQVADTEQSVARHVIPYGVHGAAQKGECAVQVADDEVPPPHVQLKMLDSTFLHRSSPGLGGLERA